jgi:hypothetical protein
MADTPMSMAMSESSDAVMEAATPTPKQATRSARRLSTAAAAAADEDVPLLSPLSLSLPLQVKDGLGAGLGSCHRKQQFPT